MKKARQLIRLADSSEFLDTLPDNCFDAVVTDPPYQLGFMNRNWDKTGISFDPKFWAKCLRVLKPGGHLLSFGGTRTWHRIAVAIEDAGFELRDTLMWITGQGFPKSLDVSKAIDQTAGAKRKVVGRTDPSNPRTAMARKMYGTDLQEEPGDGTPITAPATEAARQWEGWGSALKPAYEPILMFRKPLSEPTLAANILRWGTGGLNIDGCRIDAREKPQVQGADDRSGDLHYGAEHRPGGKVYDKGRWPANLILDETAAEMLDAEVGDSRSSGRFVKGSRIIGRKVGPASIPLDALDSPQYQDSGGPSRYFYTSKSSRLERELGLLDLEPVGTEDTVKRGRDAAGVQSPRAGAGRGAEAPRYRCRKCGKHLGGGRAVSDCPIGQAEGHDPVEIGRGPSVRNLHPTVKPLSLMQWLVVLVTPPGGKVLDPFCGTGTTIVACKIEGFSALGIDLEEKYVEIARAALKVPALRRAKPLKDAHREERQDRRRVAFDAELLDG